MIYEYVPTPHTIATIGPLIIINHYAVDFDIGCVSKTSRIGIRLPIPSIASIIINT